MSAKHQQRTRAQIIRQRVRMANPHTWRRLPVDTRGVVVLPAWYRRQLRAGAEAREIALRNFVTIHST